MKHDLPDSNKRAQDILPKTRNLAGNMDDCILLAEAGDTFLKQHDYHDALTCYGKALKDLRTISNNETDPIFIDIAVKYSKISTAALAPKQVLKTLKEAMQRALAGNLTEYQALLEMEIAKNEWLRSNYRTSLRHFDRGWSLSDQISNRKLKRAILTFKTIYPFWYGRYRDVVADYEASVPAVERLPSGKFSLFTARQKARRHIDPVVRLFSNEDQG